MIALRIEEQKKFTSGLFIGELFDQFLLREADIVTCLDGESLRSREVRLVLAEKRVNFFGPKGCSPNATARYDAITPVEVPVLGESQS